MQERDFAARPIERAPVRLSGSTQAPRFGDKAGMATHGLQCGFCTPGMIMSAAGLLARNPRPSEAQIVDAIEGNLCRCTGYVNIVAAVQQAASAMAGKGGAA